VRVAGLAVAVLLTATAVVGAEVQRITLCADPSNLPFSSQGATEPGFEVEIARAIAETAHAEFGVHWVPTAREVVVLRQLDEGRCDLFMGVPLVARFMEDKPRLIFSAPYYVMRQAIASPSIGAVRSLDDLRGKLVGVQAMTMGDRLVYVNGYTRKVYRDPAETLMALVRSEVDAVVIETPLAGWFVKKNPGFQATEIVDPPRDLEIGAAMRKTDRGLKETVDRALHQLEPTRLPAILASYGLIVAQAAPPQPPLSPELRAARSTYLTQCSQCHGTDARGTPAAANLRAFKGTDADFVRIVQSGRPGTAMVPWKGLISEEETRDIAHYIKSLPAEADRP